MDQLSELTWPVPLPLEGVKSRKKKIFNLTAAELPLGDNTLIPVEGDVSLTLSSRVCAIGEAGRSVVTATLLGDADPEKANHHKNLGMLHLGPHLLAEIRPEQTAEDFVGTVSALLGSSRAHVIILEQAKNKSLDMDTQEEEANEAWARIFGRLLRGKGFQSYKGAVVVLTTEETRAIKQVCSDLWGIGPDGKLRQEPIVLGTELEIVTDAMEALYAEGNEISLLLEEMKQLTRQAFNEDFEEYRINKPQCVLTLLIERCGVEGAEKSLHLCGYMLHEHFLPPRAEFKIDRVGVFEALRGLRYGDLLVKSGVAQAAQLPESECAWLTLKAYQCLVPWYEQFGFTDMTCDVDVDPWKLTEMALKNESKTLDEAVSV